ncbi:MAG: MetS family NSS transporter small subunit [Melioribacteraceae bacterium]|nr:MetS family NSS transporter small subunit [Melioribacteraceae bacterium]MCF8263960.1 MetS family NSS transporter small subunit [Melioribacteraceae bacterium]MCF8411812.1 MetS family NSS transporter small subunit [Melioribacteraceae bacterium]MCF8431330.1 MetS family NSS transporter small subunit [Melioribacteraceae bacterium]
MNLSSIITMLVVCGLVWGGLSFFITKAVSSENRKKQDG